ncbi:phosphoenolpyruvate carboxykinase [Methylocella tundrae]|uniref:Phosphoenolpyruvate carboxykinase (ATP) n=1 Tax=Methylocella tundrae TaxID=227605 RepID=A0A4U8Z174_METTU|nr:phosphoenolpyruvate carboxykinase [Methylocella tundrae]WPP06322.1 phosphoenolpyruvate carboxykinase [Methylocella tundrae]VFU09014.1 Phosphoenolpyruvate carboxykinase (ATP) [Methylocella tundrae]
MTNQAGFFNPSFGVEKFGLKDLKSISYNLEAPQLYEESIRRGEAKVARDGPLVAETGVHTGRSPKDKFIVRDALTEETIWWDNSSAITPAHFDVLYADMLAHAAGRDLFAQDLFGGAEPANRVNVRVITEYAWHSLFIRNLLIRPSREEIQSFVADLTILDLPSFEADPTRHGCRSQTIVAIDFSRKIVLIGGTSYAGEIKKSVFSYLNFVLPAKEVMPMHCSANVSGDGASTLFFGLSGTGKTTLSADAARTLVGDDEHGWSPEGIFNFEGGCYAKAIKLSREAEPEIFATTERFGAIMENVVLHPQTRAPDFDDASKTENTRIAYPLHFIANASATGRAGHPTNIVMLTCDAFGVLPPIAKLESAQAMYHFLSGYTAKVAGTEKGVSEPQATFSTCFGAPFMSRHPSVYGNLLRDLIARHDVNCWLVNTGWTGGKYGVGRRMPIKVTRGLLAAALDGSLAKAAYRRDTYFGLATPLAVAGIESSILNPVETWASREEFAAQAMKLVDMFRANFEKFASHVDAEVIEAQPAAVAA